MEKEKSTNHYELAYDRPEEEPTGFLNFLYNKKTGEVLGRNALSWAKITIFYIIFYICLGIFFYTCFQIFASISLSEDKPRWTLGDSLIGTNPGVGFRPMPDQEVNTDSSLIWINLKHESNTNSSFWIKQLNQFLDDMPKNPENGQECTFENGKHATATTVCNIHTEKLQGCNRNESGYGYLTGTPCVLVKLNKIFGFVPQPYLIEDLKLASERDMPVNLNDMITNLENSTDKDAKLRLNTTWISCDGENPGDREAIGKLEYYAPGVTGQLQGIPNFFFPYMNQKGYQIPFVFVKFLSPRRHALIQIECKAWAKNIIADRILRLGSVHFELMIDG